MRKLPEDYRERDKLVAQIAGQLLGNTMRFGYTTQLGQVNLGESGFRWPDTKDIEKAVHLANIVVGLSDSRPLETT